MRSVVLPGMNDHDRLFAYVEAFFARCTSRSTMWPTIHRAARSLGWTHERVELAVDGDPHMRLELRGYNFLDDGTIGPLLIVSYGEAEAA